MAGHASQSQTAMSLGEARGSVVESNIGRRREPDEVAAVERAPAQPRPRTRPRPRPVPAPAPARAAGAAAEGQMIWTHLPMFVPSVETEAETEADSEPFRVGPEREGRMEED